MKHCPYCGGEVPADSPFLVGITQEVHSYDQTEGWATRVTITDVQPCHEPCQLWYARHQRYNREFSVTTIDMSRMQRA